MANVDERNTKINAGTPADKKVSIVEETRLSDNDVSTLKQNGVDIKKNHGRVMAVFSVTDANGVSNDVKFRTFYPDANGSIPGKTPNGAVMNYEEYSAQQILDLSSGKSVDVSYTTTSGIARNDTVMLANKVNNYGNVATRPTPLDKINLNNPNELIFDKSAYEQAIEAKKQNSHASAQAKIDAVLAKSDMLEQGAQSYQESLES